MTDFAGIVENAADYYKNLLIVQYNSKQRARSIIGALVKMLYADGLAFKLQEAFDLETAEGKQLDIIGKWLGLDRFYNTMGFIPLPLFTLPNMFSDITACNYNNGGFNTIANNTTPVYAPGGFILCLNTKSQSGLMTDSLFRYLIKLKIIKNNIRMTRGEIDNAIYRFFGNNVKTIWSNSALTYVCYAFCCGLL